MVHLEALEVLIYPRKDEARPWHGALHVERSLRHQDEESGDILEAILRCDRCRARYRRS